MFLSSGCMNNIYGLLYFYRLLQLLQSLSCSTPCTRPAYKRRTCHLGLRRCLSKPSSKTVAQISPNGWQWLVWTAPKGSFHTCKMWPQPTTARTDSSISAADSLARYLSENNINGNAQPLCQLYCREWHWSAACAPLLELHLCGLSLLSGNLKAENAHRHEWCLCHLPRCPTWAPLHLHAPRWVPARVHMNVFGEGKRQPASSRTGPSK